MYLEHVRMDMHKGVRAVALPDDEYIQAKGATASVIITRLQWFTAYW